MPVTNAIESLHMQRRKIIKTGSPRRYDVNLAAHLSRLEPITIPQPLPTNRISIELDTTIPGEHRVDIFARRTIRVTLDIMQYQYR